MCTELQQEIIALLGEDRVWAVYSVAGSEPVSFAALVRCLRNRRIIAALLDGEEVDAVAKRMGVCTRTVKRQQEKLPPAEGSDNSP